MQCAGGSESGIAQLVGGGDCEDEVVRREALSHGNEVDGDPGCELLAVIRVCTKLVHTLQQSRSPLGHIFDEHLAPAVEHEAIQRRLLFILGDRSAHLARAASALLEHFNGVP